MSTLNLAIQTGRSTAQLGLSFETAAGPHSLAQRIQNYVSSVQTGTELAGGAGLPPSIAISIKENAVRASATLTCVTVVDTNTVVINGVTFTAVSAAPSTNEFVRATSNTTTATNLAAAINASVTALVSGYVTASSALGVVTVYSTNYGIYGNQVTLSAGGGTITASSTRLVSGAADATAQTISF